MDNENNTIHTENAPVPGTESNTPSNNNDISNNNNNEHNIDNIDSNIDSLENLDNEEIDNLENININNLPNNTNVQNHNTNVQNPNSNPNNNTNENINSFIRTALAIRESNLHDINELQDLLSLHRYYRFFFTKSYLLLSTLINIAIICIMYLYFQNKEYDLYILEQEDTVGFFFFISVLLLFNMWNVYLFIYFMLTKFEIISDDIIHLEISTQDILYFNPFFFNMIIYHTNKTYLVNSFDIFTLTLISMHYAVNFQFSRIMCEHFHKKITSILNFYLDDNTILLVKLRIGYVIMMSANVVVSCFIYMLIQDTDFIYKYLILFKVSLINYDL